MRRPMPEAPISLLVGECIIVAYLLERLDTDRSEAECTMFEQLTPLPKSNWM